MSQSKAEEITDILREEILRGQYRAGERLPSERDLSARFEANRGSVREATKKLEQLGIVDVKPGGVRIVPIEDATLEVLGHLMDLEEVPDPTLVGQIFEVIGAMISLSARSAIHKADNEQIEEMGNIINGLIQKIDSGQDHYEGWRDLGDLFTEINQNLILRLIGNGLKIQFVARLERTGIRPDIDKQQDRVMLDMMSKAIKERDHQTASNAIIGHFELVKEAFLEALDDKYPSEIRSLTHA
jgi:GntR family transcriptional repressor for pyruvate dehydrogenase complex